MAISNAEVSVDTFFALRYVRYFKMNVEITYKIRWGGGVTINEQNISTTNR